MIFISDIEGNKIFHDEKVKVHIQFETDKVFECTGRVINEKYPVYSNIVIDGESPPLNDTMLFFPISENEFRTKHEIIVQRYGYIITYAIEIQPMIQVVDNPNDKDVFKARILFGVHRFIYHIDNGEVYIDAFKDPLCPYNTSVIQSSRGSISAELDQFLNNTIDIYCEHYLENVNI